MHQVITEAIETLGGKPFLWELEDKTGLPAGALKAQLKDYPAELLISRNEKRVLECYNPNLNIRQIADMVGVAPAYCRKLIISLSNRNLLKYTVRETERDTDQATYVEVTTGRNIEIKVNGKKQIVSFKGARGFISDLKHDYTYCKIYKDCRPYNLKLLANEYKVIGA